LITLGVLLGLLPLRIGIVAHHLAIHRSSPLLAHHTALHHLATALLITTLLLALALALALHAVLAAHGGAHHHAGNGVSIGVHLVARALHLPVLALALAALGGGLAGVVAKPLDLDPLTPDINTVLLAPHFLTSPGIPELDRAETLRFTFFRPTDLDGLDSFQSVLQVVLEDVTQFGLVQILVLGRAGKTASEELRGAVLLTLGLLVLVDLLDLALAVVNVGFFDGGLLVLGLSSVRKLHKAESPAHVALDAVVPGFDALGHNLADVQALEVLEETFLGGFQVEAPDKNLEFVFSLLHGE